MAENNNALGNLFTRMAESIRGGLGEIGKMKPNTFPDRVTEIVSLLEYYRIHNGGNGGGESESPLKFTSGSFRPTEDRKRRTIEHGLGCMPDFVIVYMVGFPAGYTVETFTEANPIISAWGFKSNFGANTLSYLGWPSVGWSHKQYGIDTTSDAGQESGYIYCPDESTFQVGFESGDDAVGLSSGVDYAWIAVSGLGSMTAPPVLQPLTITENGTYTAPEGVDGYNPVTVDVPAPEVNLQDKTITENGEYTADSGFDGLGKVTVDVAGSGGGSLPAGAYWEALDFPLPTNTGFKIIEFNGEVYAFANKSADTSSGIYYFYKWENNTWTLILGDSSFVNVLASDLREVIYNGKIHMTGREYKFHKAFDGTSLTNYADLPQNIDGAALFVQNDKLKAYSYRDGCVYVWDEATDTWTLEASLFSSYIYAGFYNVGGTIYVADKNKVYTYDGSALTQVGTFTNPVSFSNIQAIVAGDKLYFYVTTSQLSPARLYKYDTEMNTAVFVGCMPSAKNQVRSLATYQSKLAITPHLDMTYAPIMILHEATE